MSHATDHCKETTASRLRARLVCATALALLMAPDAMARSIAPLKPSVEVHLEVLKDLEASTKGTSFAAPVQGRDSISAKPLPPVGGATPAPAEPLTASGRKIPSEQPDMGQYGALKRTPVNTPFGRVSAPLPKPAVVATKPKPKPVVKVEEKAVAKVEPKKAPAVEKPKPQDEKKLMDALEKETVAATPPKVETKPAPVAATLKPDLAASPALPDIALPEAPPVPELKPDLALPEPPPLPDLNAATADVPKLPLPAPDVLVVDKKAAGDLPPIPALPAPGETMPKPEAELMPSLSKRMDTLFAKQPEKEGVIEDKTTLEGPSEASVKQAEEAKQRLAEHQEKMRQEQLKAKEELTKQAESTPSFNMPAPTEVPKLGSTEIAALPPVTLPGEAIPASSGEMDLPPPALPPLTAITGEGDEKSSLDIVQPQDGVESSGNTAPAMQPLDAPENLPKVTKGEEEMPALPPLDIPEEDAKKSAPPSLPDFSAMKTPEKKEETKVATATLPKPEFVKAEEAAAPEPAPVIEGSVAGTFTFEKDKTDLDDKAKAQLNAVAEQIIKGNKQVRIVAYAAGTAEQASIARRISLSRALQVRAYLIDKGVNQLKINVQALGNKISGGEPERADVYIK